MNLIAAVDQNWAIGYRNQLLLRIPADLSFFRNQTIWQTVIMGRQTFLSLPNRQPLANRTNIVLTTNAAFQAPGTLICHSPAELWPAISALPTEQLWVIGGASVYQLLLPYCTHAYLTKIAQNFTADRWLPNLDHHPHWHLQTVLNSGIFQGINFTTVLYTHQLNDTIAFAK